MAAGNQQLGFAIRAINEAKRAMQDVEGDLKGVEGAADKADGAMGRFGSALGNVATVAAGFLTANVIKAGFDNLKGFIGSSIDEAAELEQSIGGVESVFKDAAVIIEEFGKTSAQSVGLSKNEVNQLASATGAFLKNYGFDAEGAALQTLELTRRASDMAAMFGGDVSAAMAAIQAGLRGQADPLERYGVSLNAARVEAEALAMTGKAAAKELTDQEKMAARLSIIFGQTADAAGQFAREQDTAAGKAAILGAKQKDLAAELGTHLLPVQIAVTEAKLQFVNLLATRVVPFIAGSVIPTFKAIGETLSETVMPPIRTAMGIFESFRNYLRWTWEDGDYLNDALADMPPAIKPIVRELGILVAAFKENVLPQLGRFVDWFRSNRTAMTAAGVAIGTVLAAAFVGLAVAAGAAAVAMVAAALPIVAMVAAVGALGAGIYLLIENWDTIVEKWPMAGEIVDAVRARFASFVEFVQVTVVPLIQNLAVVVGEAMATAAQWFQYHWDNIQRIIEGVLVIIGGVLDGWLTAITAAIEGGLLIITGVVNTVMGILTGDWDRAWEGIKGIVDGIWTIIKGIVEGALKIIEGVVKGGVEVIKGVWNIGWSAIKDWFGQLWEGIKSTASTAMKNLKTAVGQVIEDIKGLGPKMLEAAEDLGGKMLDGIKSGLSKTGGFVTDVASSLLSALKSLVNNHIIDPINRAMEFSIGGSVFGKDFSININPPDIPHLAKGGIVTRPTLALIGEAGPEAVVPLSRGRGMGMGGVKIERIEININGGADRSAVPAIKRGIFEAMDEWWNVRSRQSLDWGVA